MGRLENLKNIILYLMADEHVSYQIPFFTRRTAANDAGTDERLGVQSHQQRVQEDARCRVADAASG